MTEVDFPYPPEEYRYLDNKLGEKISYLAENITHKSNIKKTETNRPFSLRGERAEIYKKIQETKDIEKRTSLIERAHNLDNLFLQFTNDRKQVEVELGGLGIQSAQYVELETKKMDINKPPLVLIPGISNDLDSVGEFPIQLALAGRKVIMVAMPESWNGKVTEEFCGAVNKADNFEPHVSFFKSAIEKILGDEKDFDICGVSAGSIIVSELLRDKNLNKRINQANLIAPPATVKNKNVTSGLIKETASIFIKNFNRLPRISPANHSVVKKTSEEREIMQKTFEGIRDKLVNEYQWWNHGLLSGHENKTVVISFNHDYVANTKSGVEKIKKNSDLIVKEIDGSHSTPDIEAERVIEQMAI